MQIREFEKYIPEGAELIWFCADTQKCRSYPHYRLNNEEFKWCSVCHKWLLLDAFDHNSTVSDGFASPCRKCVRERYLASRDRRLSKQNNRRDYTYPILFTPPSIYLNSTGNSLWTWHWYRRVNALSDTYQSLLWSLLNHTLHQSSHHQLTHLQPEVSTPSRHTTSW